ncbi:hypothetical protein [Rhizobium acaciae]|uniref:hypothetical protein n=1 Tax=Rhizobium acaciae TaxID=2989736 RepID=UPI00221F37E4|nr:hypothetical protein [Rhizobium acaciae]MCW1749949.1 hypothetical protein [Rhizobium acaciae]
MTAFDDLFDATLSTILHAGMEMFGGTKNRKTGLSLTLGEESEKSLMILVSSTKKASKQSFGPLF